MIKWATEAEAANFSSTFYLVSYTTKCYAEASLKLSNVSKL